jgi:Secretion system C-terminal sorting domain
LPAHELQDSVVGETVTFKVDGHDHQLWVEETAGGTEIMVMSERMSVAAKLSQWNGAIKGNQQLSYLKSDISEAKKINTTLKQKSNSAKTLMDAAKRSKTPADQAKAAAADKDVETTEALLRNSLKKLFAAFGEEETNFNGFTVKLITPDKIDTEIILNLEVDPRVHLKHGKASGYYGAVLNGYDVGSDQKKIDAKSKALIIAEQIDDLVVDQNLSKVAKEKQKIKLLGELKNHTIHFFGPTIPNWNEPEFGGVNSDGFGPGMNSTTKEFELTPHVGANDTFEVDYDISQDPYGNYVFFGTLIGYGPMNHAHDPEIDIILAPSAQMLHSRWNPICNQPKFVLRNLGSQPLTDLNIIFGVVGGTPQSFHWTGNLGFMQRQEVELTSLDNSMWWGDDESLSTFFIQLGFSTDGADDNPSNNYAESTFYRPATYQYTNLDDNRLIIQLKTNASNQQSSYVLYDVNGNVVFERDNFAAPNTTYRDTLELNSGCYLFHLKDSGEDGLSFFANDDGNGNCKLDRVSGLEFINFENDFGKEIKHYFNWNTDLVSVHDHLNQLASLQVYPVPASGWVKVKIAGMDRKVQLRVIDMTGKVIQQELFRRNHVDEELSLDTSTWADGTYHLVIDDGDKLAQLTLMHVQR